MAIGSRIQTRLLTNRPRNLSEKMKEQNKTDIGSPGSFAAEAPQMIVRIQEDSKELKKRRPGGTTDIDPQAKNLDLQKAYPIVNKP